MSVICGSAPGRSQQPSVLDLMWQVTNPTPRNTRTRREAVKQPSREWQSVMNPDIRNPELNPDQMWFTEPLRVGVSTA